MREQTGDQVEVYVPFYRGHHLIGGIGRRGHTGPQCGRGGYRPFLRNCFPP